MSPRVRSAVCCWVLLAVCWAPSNARAEDRAARQLRLVLHLVDGTRLTGIPSKTNLAFRIEGETREVALASVRTLEPGVEGVDALTLSGGNAVSGRIVSPSLRLVTAFGNVTVRMRDLRQVHVQRRLESVVLEVFVDSALDLHVTAGGLYWRDAAGAPSERPKESTWVNGREWTPEWRKRIRADETARTELLPLNLAEPGAYSLELLAVGKRRGCRVLDKREPVERRPGQDGLVIRIPDLESGGRWYRFRLCLD